MEKIYEENHNEKRPKKMTFSIVLSFVVALFAIVSLIALGFNQISYAAPDDSGPSTRTVEFLIQDGSINVGVNATVGSDSFFVPMMYTTDDDGNKTNVFCIEYGKVATADGDAYQSNNETYGDAFQDDGLVYILNQSRVLGGDGIAIKHRIDNLADEALEVYATQVAIWEYLHDRYPGDDRGAFNIAVRGKTVSVDLQASASSGELPVATFDNSVIDTVVDNAKRATNAKTVQAVLASKNISLIGDSDLYQTDEISVDARPREDLIKYYVDLSGLDGAYVVDANGNTKSSDSPFRPGEKFYVRVPVNKVTDTKKTVNVKISGDFQNYIGGQYYMATNAQAIVSVVNKNFRIDNSTPITFEPVADTKMSTAQTIYFIGLIVLLCGVGIIYANAKPVEEK